MFYYALFFDPLMQALTYMSTHTACPIGQIRQKSCKLQLLSATPSQPFTLRCYGNYCKIASTITYTLQHRQTNTHSPTIFRSCPDARHLQLCNCRHLKVFLYEQRKKLMSSFFVDSQQKLIWNPWDSTNFFKALDI